MNHEDYQSVLKRTRLKNGLPWGVPITLSVNEDEYNSIRRNEEIALANPNGDIQGILRVRDRYKKNLKAESKAIYRTTEEAHPGVEHLYSTGPYTLGGTIQVFNRKAPGLFPRYHKDPAETREEFINHGWKTVVAFQTRNPIHRAHEYLQKCALEMVDGLMIHPVVGETKKGDISAAIRMRCYTSLIKNYYPKDRVMLVTLPMAMRYAGPREAIHHAIIRKNHGCSHFIVGRDHAGVGNYYGTYDAQKIFERFTPEEIGIIPLKFEHTFFCKKCDGMGSSKTCAHSTTDHVFLSGTRVRELLKMGQAPPIELTRPEVANILIKAFHKKK